MSTLLVPAPATSHGAAAAAVRPPTLSCAVVASGTSRFVVLGAGSVAAQDREALVRDVVLGRGASSGFGDQHYQGNKVVLVEDAPTGTELAFQFFQVSGQSGRVYSRMECSNAAPAAAVWARLHLPGWSDQGGNPIRVRNLSTGQAMVVEPPTSVSWWRDGWGVCFTDLESLRTALTRDAEPFTVHADGLTVSGTVVEHGNVFVLAEVPPGRVTPALVARLVEVGDNLRSRRRLPPGITKVLPYQLTSALDETMLCGEAACFSSGQRHHSLPGSAAMVLGAFLTAQGLARPVPGLGSATGRATVRLTHPSGSMTVHCDVADLADPASVVATSFITPVGLLLSGTAVI